MAEARDLDVIVAGGGPAGSTTALRLARAGFEVALVEARKFPRFKPCGEFMSPEALPILRDLGVDADLAALGAREVRGMLLHGHGHRAGGRFVDVGRAHAPCDHGWALRREVFDQALLQAAERAGVRVLQGLAVVGLLRDGAGAVCGVLAKRPRGETIALRAPYTIGADGVRSRVAAALGVRRPTPWLDKLALTTRYAGVPWGEHAEVHFHERGYFACAPVDTGLVSLNLVLERAQFAREGAGAAETLERWLERTPALAERLRQGTRVDPVRGIGTFAASTRAQVFDGAALVGDACGYVDPLTGEGIYFALKGAEMLAAALVPALHAGRADRRALDPYLAGRRREIVPRAALSVLLQLGLKHPRIVRAALGLLAARPRLVDTLVSITGDYVPLRELARPSVWISALRASGPAA